MILWDKVVESTDEAHLFEEDMTIKYGLIDEVCDQIVFSSSVTSTGRSIVQVVSALLTGLILLTVPPSHEVNACPVIIICILLMLLPPAAR